MGSKDLTLKEEMLLNRMQELSVLCDKVSGSLADTQSQVRQKDEEIKRLQGRVRALLEENQHQKEVLQTWRVRLESVLKRLS